MARAVVCRSAPEAWNDSGRVDPQTPRQQARRPLDPMDAVPYSFQWPPGDGMRETNDIPSHQSDAEFDEPPAWRGLAFAGAFALVGILILFSFLYMYRDAVMRHVPASIPLYDAAGLTRRPPPWSVPGSR